MINLLRLFCSESRQLLMLGAPIIITQLAQASIGFVDTLVAGQYATLDLAAVALGFSIWSPLFLTCIGIIMATTPLVAHASGAVEPDKIVTTFRQGLWVALLCSGASIGLLYQADSVLTYLQVDAPLAAKTMNYLHAIAWGFPGILFYQLLRSYFEGLGKTRPAMLIALLALLANIPLNYLLVFGYWGFPELGAVGCGLASALVMWMMLACGLFMLHRCSGLQLPQRPARWIDLIALGQFLKLGVPMGIAILIESSMFSVIALLLAPLGTQVVAGHQITITVTGLIFMIPLSLSMACTIRVGQQLGRNAVQGARRSAASAVTLTALIAVLTSIGMWHFAGTIAQLFSDEPAVILLATRLLMIAALFEISDAMQVTAAGALRGYKDTAIPLLFVCTAYWLIGLPLGYTLAMTDYLIPATGAAGFWYGLIVGLTIAALMLAGRLIKVSGRALGSATPAA